MVQILPRDQWKVYQLICLLLTWTAKRRVLLSAADGSLSLQVVRSDTDCEGSSESEIQRESKAQMEQKKGADVPKPDVIAENQCRHEDELVKKLQNTSLTCTGTVMEL